MKFSDYLKSKRNFLIFWFVFHGFALFVNVFKLEGQLIYEVKWEKDTLYTDHLSEKYVNIFTSNESNGFRESTSSFWPFSVKYERIGDYKLFFPGIFYKYDYSEFIAYSLLIILIFYIKWEKNKE